MAWDDARNLSAATSRAPVDGTTHLQRLYRQVMQTEQEELPEDAVKDPEPRREVIVDGRRTDPPSWRYRVTTDLVVYDSILVRPNMPRITEVEVVALVGWLTEGQRKQLEDKDDPQANWRIAGFEIVNGIKKKRRVKVHDPEHDMKLMAWEGRKQNPGMNGANMAMSPAKTMHLLREAEGFELRIVWFDMARQEEPQVGAFKPYLQNGYYPPAYKKQRAEAFRILKSRLAGSDGTLTDIAQSTITEVTQLAGAGMPIERIATLLAIDPDVVKRIVIAQTAKPANPPKSVVNGEKKPRKKRAAPQSTATRGENDPSGATPPATEG